MTRTIPVSPLLSSSCDGWLVQAARRRTLAGLPESQTCAMRPEPPPSRPSRCLSSPTPLTPVFVPGEEGRTIYRIPSLLSVGDTLFAFAEPRTGSQDGCYPLHPAKGDGRTAIHFKTSTDGGKSWSNMTDICPKAPNCTSSACKEWMNRSCLDFEAVYDGTYFDANFPRGSRPWAVTLRKDSPTPSDVRAAM